MALNNISGIICVNKAGETTTIPVAELISSFGAIQDPTDLSSGSVPKVGQGKFVASGIIELDGGQLQFKNYNNKGSFTGKAIGLIAFDSNGNIVTYPLSTTPISNNITTSTSVSGTFNGTPFTVPYYNSAGDDLLASDMQVNNGNWYLGSGNPFFKFGIGFGSINIDQGNIGDGYRMNGKMVMTIDRENNEVMIGNSVYNTTNIENIKTSKVIFGAIGGGSITDIAADTTGNFILTKPAKNGTYALISDITEQSWLLTANTLTAKSFLGSLNNFDVGFKRNNVEYLTLDANGITSLKDITSSGNLTLQKGNPRLRLRDTGAGGHTQGFDLHVNGDEFIIDDNTHSKNILRNYLNSSVHTTDFDAEVYNFKNVGSTYANLSSNGLNLGNIQAESTDVDKFLVSNAGLVKYRTGTQILSDIGAFATPTGLTTNYVTKWNGTALANSQIFDNGTTVSIGSALGISNKFEVGNASYGTIAAVRSVPLDGINPYLAIKTSANGVTIEQNGSQYKNLYFQTSALDRLTILANGNVGVGVDPSYKLDVNGKINTITNAFGGGGFRMSAYSGVAGSRAYLFANDIYNYGNFGILQSTTNSNEPSLIPFLINSSGNIGIGTTTPTLGKLQVVGAIYQQNADASGVGIYTNGAMRFLSNQNFIDFNNSGAANNISFRNGSGVRTDLFISAAGSIGAGTTNPTARFHTYTTTANAALIESNLNTGTALFQLKSGLGNLLTQYNNGYLQFGGTTGNAVTVETNGNIGIGISSQIYKLTANDTTKASILATGYASHATAQSVANGEIALGSNVLYQGKIGYDAANNANMRFTNTYSISDTINGGFDFFNATTRLFRMTSNGRFGNMASPAYNLDITGTGHFTGAVTFDTVPSSLQDATSSNHLVRYSQWIASTSVKYLPTAVNTVSLTNVTSLSGLRNINGVTGVANLRILLMGQSTLSQNGVWVMQSGAWTRATDSDTDPELRGFIISINQGTFAGYKYINTNQSVITVNTTDITYSEFSNLSEIDPIFVSWRDQSRTANTVFMAPNGTNGAATWRALVSGDIPSLDFTSKISGKPTTVSGYGITDYNSLWDTQLSTKTTTNLAEGTNLYYTQARFDTAFGVKSTTNLTEGTNLYYTQARFDTAFANKFALENNFTAGNIISADGYTGVNINFQDGSIDGFFINSPDGDSYFGSLETGYIYTLQGANSGGTTGQFLHKNKTTNALEWYSIVKADVGLGNVEDTALSTWTGSTNITILGNISAGTWNGTTIGINKGGTGLAALGTANQLLRVNAGATALEYFTPTYISGNQTITLSGIVTGSGNTSITTSISDNALTIAKTNGLQSALDARMVTASYPDIVAIEALTGTTGLLRKTALNTWSLDTTSYQTALTGLTTNYLTKWNGTTLANTQLFDNGTNVGIGTTTPNKLLDINGDALINGLTIGRGNNNLSKNTVIGYFALSSNTTGDDNTTIGYVSLAFNTTGRFNTAIGSSALSSNNTGNHNTANGYSSLLINTIGNSNTAIGSSSLASNSSGSFNVANGYQSLYLNTTGWNNTASGSYSLYSNTTGRFNTANGFNSLYLNTTGWNNVGIGYNAGYNITTGNNNVFVGYNSGLGITTGSNNIIIGANTTGLSASLSNYIILGDNAGFRRFVINDLGNAGLGLDNPLHKLHVNGDIRATTNLIVDGNASFGLTNPLVISQKDYVQGATTAFYNEVTSTGKWLRINTDSGFSLRHNEIDAISFDNDSWKFNTTFKVVQGEEINDWTGFNIDDRFRLGINDNTGLATFEMVYENSIVRNFFNEEGILSHIDTSGSVRKYLREGDIVGGGTNVIPNLQQVTEQGANSTLRMQFNGVNYATMSDLSSSQGLDSVLGIGNTGNNKNIFLNGLNSAYTLGYDGTSKFMINHTTAGVLNMTQTAGTQFNITAASLLNVLANDIILTANNGIFIGGNNTNVDIQSELVDIASLTTLALSSGSGDLNVLSNTGFVNLGYYNPQYSKTRLGRPDSGDYIYMNGQKYNFSLPTVSSGDYLVMQINGTDVTVKKATIFASGGKNYLTI